MSDSIANEVRDLTGETVRLRRDFHQHPEVGFEEFRTAGIVAERLRQLGLEVKTGVAGTGVVGLLRGQMDGRTLMIRADIDALSIQETNTAEYASANEGVSHACGHDAHTAMLLTTAGILSRHRTQLTGNVKFVFQPAEERARGAAPMVREGVLENPTVDAAIGLHVWNEMPVGKVGLRVGPMMAAVDFFQIDVLGKGGHGAMPHQTADPIIAAAQVITALQTITSREVPPTKTAVVSVCRVSGGTVANIIPSKVQMAGTARSFDKEIRESLPGRIERVVKGVTSALQCDYEFSYSNQCPATVNDEVMTELVRSVAQSVVGAENVLVAEQTTGGEDMSYFLEEVPGCYFFLGSNNKKTGLSNPHHSPNFDIDESCLPLGVEILSKTALAYLSPTAP